MEQTAESLAGRMLQKVEAFLAKTGMSPSRLGRVAIGDGSLITQMREGRKPRPETLEKIEVTIRKVEADHQRRLGVALTAIRRGDGYVQLDAAGEPVNLPAGVEMYTFNELVKSGQLEPGRDSFLGGKPQTYRPI